MKIEVVDLTDASKDLELARMVCLWLGILIVVAMIILSFEPRR